MLCEPTELYNIIVKGSKDPACLDETYLVLFDTRLTSAYFRDHIILARSAKNKKQDDQNETPEFFIPFDVHLPTLNYCVVYDSKTVSIIENTPAVRLANMLACSGSKNPILVLKGGYERFSAEYPFLRTEKTIYTPREVQHLPRYPSEILSLFLYVGEKRDACNAALNYDLKINHHVALGEDISPLFPGKIESLHVTIRDSQEDQLPFTEIYEFIESCWQKSGRVLVYEESGCSRSAAAAMAYLIKKNNIKLKEACDHVRKCRVEVLPLQTFLDQLSVWESHVVHDDVP